jgi:hypothetical protein
MNPQGQFKSVTQLPKPKSHKLLNTHINPSTPTLFYPACTTQENGPPSLPHNPSGFPSPSRAQVQLVQNLHVGTLRTHSCEKNLSTDPRISDMQVLIHGWNTPIVSTANNTIASLQQLVFLSQSKTRMRKYEWVKE